MDFIENQFNEITEDQAQFRDHFMESCGPIPRRVFLFQTLQYLMHVKDQVNNKPPEAKGLVPADLKNMMSEHSATYLSKKIAAQYEVMLSEKEKGTKIDADDVFWLVVKTFKWEFIAGVAFFNMDAVFRISFSVAILYLFQAVNSNNYTQAYILSAVLIILWYGSQLMKQSACVVTYILGSQIKGALAMLLYTKISKLTSYVLKNSQLGKITNLLANDLSVIEMRLIALMMPTQFPLLITGVTILLITRISWVAVVGLFLVLLMLPISNQISKRNGQTIEQINKYKDKRVQITTETIQGIKYVKLYGWELAFKKIIQEIREKEVHWLKKLAFGRSLERALATSIGFLSSTVMFALVAQVNHELTFALIFSTLEIMASMKMNVMVLSLGLGLYYEIKVVYGRFASIFNMENTSMIEIDQSNKEPFPKDQALPEQTAEWNSLQFIYQPMKKTSKLQEEGSQLGRGTVSFKNFNGYWKSEFATPSLKNINYDFKSGKLYGITGKVGSGKSGIIGAMLRQIPYYSGKIDIQGSIAYVEQEPIVFSDTIHNNITFGREFNEKAYENAVNLSCLKSDFQILAEGDQTIVGQKGITLSGGQKARLALARAIYTEADIYLLDDPISAVDAKVAKIIFQNCLRQLAEKKTVILVTHQIHYIYQCDEAIIMDDGVISASGQPAYVSKYLQELSQAFKEDEEEKLQPQPEDEENPDEEKPEEQQLLTKIGSPTKLIEESEIQSNKNTLTVGVNKPENKMKNRFNEKNLEVTFSTYVNFYLTSKYNYALIPLTFLFFIISQGILTMYYRFLADFDNVSAGTSIYFNNNFQLFWGIQAILVGLYFLIIIIKIYMLYSALLNASAQVHENMIQSIVRCPGKFFDTTPSGILVNKFSTDLGIIDNTMIFGLIDALEGPIIILVALANICQINLFFLIPTVIVLFVAISFFKYARPAIMGCKQLDLQKKSPIFHFYSQTINGLTQIKVYKQRKANIQKFSQIINTSTKCAIAFDMVSRGFGFYQTVTTIFLMMAGMLMGISQISAANSGLYGVTIVYLITISDVMQWILRQVILVESLMVSAERILKFDEFERQKELRTPYDRQIGLGAELDAAENNEDLHQEWPDKPSIEFVNLSARYDKDLPLVLKNVSFKVEANEKVGIVGRTGAGKSSIIQALFRIFQPEIGSQYIMNDCNALEMGLHSLRQHISVIPQVPFLFKGTVRQNVDPFATASDDKLWEVLEESGLRDHVSNLEKKLDTGVENISQCFSVGQKQLLCLARALLRRNKILVLDEATSNVDMQTDAFIQDVIRQKFTNTTVITIAHRLNTIADYDKVIVMKRGRIKEQGSPWELLQKGGQFYEMVQHTGKNAQLITNKARDYHLKKVGQK